MASSYSWYAQTCASPSSIPPNLYGPFASSAEIIGLIGPRRSTRSANILRYDYRCNSSPTEYIELHFGPTWTAPGGLGMVRLPIQGAIGGRDLEVLYCLKRTHDGIVVCSRCDNYDYLRGRIRLFPVGNPLPSQPGIGCRKQRATIVENFMSP